MAAVTAAACEPLPGDPYNAGYGYGYGYAAPAPAPYYGGYAPGYAPGYAAPPVVIGVEGDRYRGRDYDRGRFDGNRGGFDRGDRGGFDRGRAEQQARQNRDAQERNRRAQEYRVPPAVMQNPQIDPNRPYIRRE